ncbi:MAG: S9 family peptidase [Candidatus Eremiobacteraeota bacterium]|nr:S9 family peptidase [Candidatus Eremiobacteraeota bacterium]MBC5802119.1 S9 family peptidase [Candidatus Eremiobacteraeota bacterium]MBC5822466.1 S9 family peptidase [Candidatus Eremiobacteraeota bacterium]
MRSHRFVAFLSLGALLGATPTGLGPYPPTPKIAVVDHLFGRTYVDDYRWLEDDDAPRVKAWAARQRAYALDYLRSRPSYAPLRARIRQLRSTSTARFALQIDADRFVYERTTPPQAQPALVEREGLAGGERVLYDPVAAAHGGTPEAIEAIFPSPDGSKVAFTTQAGGSEEETMHVVDAATGSPLADTIAHAGGGVSPSALVWDADGRGFLYARWPRDVPAAQRHFNIALYHHALGADPAADAYVFGHGQSQVAEYALLRSRDGSRTAALIEPGDLGDYAVWVRDGSGPFTRVASIADHVKSAAFLGNTLLLRTSARHPTFDVLALDAGTPFSAARIFIAAGRLPLEDLYVADDALYATYSDGGDSLVRRFAASGKPLGAIALPPHVAVRGVAGDPTRAPVIIDYASYDTPGRWLRYDPATNATMPTGIETKPPADYSRLIVRRVFVPSSDGTVRIPLSIVHLPGVRTDGSAPTVLYAYGGYGIITAPNFVGTGLAWLERGGVLADANVRGGGEYGEAWHRAALHATKTKSSDDLAACARYLETHGYGDARHLGILGGSDGGFLMGLAITRNPSVYRAVVGEVGIYDIPRWQRSPNGASNVPEFGDARTAADFAYIMRQSPYQNVRDGVAYPAMLLTTGENDPRVSPMNSRKMTARLQAATSSRNPILLIQNAGQGHGIGNSFEQGVSDDANVMTFFASQLAGR